MTVSVVGDPPDWLHPAGKRMWHELVEMLDGKLQPVDKFALVGACGAYGAMEAALQDLNERGPLVKARGKDGEESETRPMVKNPANQVAREQGTAFRQWVGEFGLTPAARKRLAFDLSKKAESEAGALID